MISKFLASHKACIVSFLKFLQWSKMILVFLMVGDESLNQDQENSTT